MSYSLLLVAILLLSLLILRIIPQKPLREFFADFKTDPDIQTWIDFQNKEYCPFWTDLMEIASKNDQADKPKDQQLTLADYSKTVQNTWNKDNNTNITFVLCSPITADMPLTTLLQLVPEGPQNYLDSLNVLTTKMANAIHQVNAALKNEGFTPFKREFEYVDNPDTTTTYTSTDGTNITFTTKPKTPEEQKQEADQQQLLLQRIKAILKELDKIREQMKKARQQKAQLEEIKKKGEDGSLYSKDGTVPKAKSYGPPNGRLFYR
jgi:hypothetical protein